MRLNPADGVIHRRDIGAECPADHIQKTPRPGGTFVVHQKIREMPLFIKPDHLAVLAADINDRAGLRMQPARPDTVTGDFRDLFVRKVRQLAAIAGEGQIRFGVTFTAEGFPGFQNRGLRPERSRDQEAAQDHAAVFITEQNPFGGRRARVNTDTQHDASL